MYAPVILGTARVGSYSENVARFVLGEAAKAELETEIIDVRNYRTPASDDTQQGPQAKILSEKISADALIIVSPEYNHGYPGELKTVLDLLCPAVLQKAGGILRGFQGSPRRGQVRGAAEPGIDRAAHGPGKGGRLFLGG